MCIAHAKCALSNRRLVCANKYVFILCALSISRVLCGVYVFLFSALCQHFILHQWKNRAKTGRIKIRKNVAEIQNWFMLGLQNSVSNSSAHKYAHTFVCIKYTLCYTSYRTPDADWLKIKRIIIKTKKNCPSRLQWSMCVHSFLAVVFSLLLARWINQLLFSSHTHIYILCIYGYSFIQFHSIQTHISLFLCGCRMYGFSLTLHSQHSHKRIGLFEYFCDCIRETLCTHLCDTRLFVYHHKIALSKHQLASRLAYMRNFVLFVCFFLPTFWLYYYYFFCY